VAAPYAAQYPAEALEWAQRVDRSRFGGSGLWAQALAGVAERDPDLALQLALDAGRPMQELAISTVINTIAARDPQLAMRSLEKMPAGQNRSQVAAQIASRWAQSDPAAAIAWLGSLGDRNARQIGFTQMGAELAQSNIETAIRLTDQIPADSRAMWIANVASGYAQYDVEAAVQWMKKNQSAPGYRQALPNFLWTLAQQDPDAAFSFATQAGDDDRERDQAIASVVQAVAQQTPATAAKWIAHISDENIRRAAVTQVVGQWAAYDLPGARKWASSLDTGLLRDAALTSLIAYSSSSLEDVEPLIMQIQSGEARMEAVMQAALRLSSEDPEAARDLLRRHPLDPPHQQQLDAFRQRAGKGW
jgi:hypothetical protein